MPYCVRWCPSRLYQMKSCHVISYTALHNVHYITLPSTQYLCFFIYQPINHQPTMEKCHAATGVCVGNYVPQLHVSKSWDELRRASMRWESWAMFGWDAKSWEKLRWHVRRDEMRWDETRWDEVWSVTCEVRSAKCEVWTVKCAVWNAILGAQSVAWWCNARRSCAGHVLGQQQWNRFAQSTHTRASLAQGACKVYGWKVF